jgi:transposase
MNLIKNSGVSMQQAREAIKLILNGNISDREIARRLNVSHMTVGTYRKQVSGRELTYDEVIQMSDDKLELVLKTKKGRKKQIYRSQPDYVYIHEELKKKSVTMQLLWEEYKEQNQDGYSRTQFCHLYRLWNKKLNYSMRQTHKAGDKMFVDYSGQLAKVTDPTTGEVKSAQIFVAVLGASSYTYAEASWDQSLSSWITSHVNAFSYFGGVTALIVPDNLKSGVNKPCRFEPEINRTYYEMASYYNSAIAPARVRKPKDKAKAEVGVQIVQRWILAALRNRIFFSLLELNNEILKLLEKLNKKEFKKLKGSRLSLFKIIDKPQLRPLPVVPYEYAEWKKVRVNNDYHVELNNHYYSVPCELIHSEVNVRYTNNVIEVFTGNNRVASHLRSIVSGEKTTLPNHMPKSHRQYLELTPSKILDWSKTKGAAVEDLINRIMNSKRHQEFKYRSCLGIMKLSKYYSDERIEKACKRALKIGGISYKSVKSILKKGLDLHEADIIESNSITEHSNIRGRSYYLNNVSIKKGEYLC